MQTSGALRRENAGAYPLTVIARHPVRPIGRPDDRLQRAIQYSEAPVIEPTCHGVLDPACAGYDSGVFPYDGFLPDNVATKIRPKCLWISIDMFFIPN
jgi:hypothetical protein